MRISDWSSDVCSSDLRPAQALEAFREAYEQSPGDADLAARVLALRRAVGLQLRGVRTDAENTPPRACFDFADPLSGARAVDRKSVVSGKSVQYVEISVVAVSIIKKTQEQRNTVMMTK